MEAGPEVSRLVLVAGFAMLVAALAALEAAARLSHRGLATLDELMAVAVRHPAGRLAALASWLWVGWHLFVR